MVFCISLHVERAAFTNMTTKMFASSLQCQNGIFGFKTSSNYILNLCKKVCSVFIISTDDDHFGVSQENLLCHLAPH